MSYQNGTTHFNLPQTVGSDKRDWFDTNEAFRDVDEALHTASVDSSTAIEQIAEANADIVAVDTKADGIADRVTVVEGKQATDEENISQNSLAITQLNSRVTGLGTDLAEMIEVTEEPSATATVQHTVGSYFRYNDNLYITTVLIRVGDEIVPDVNCETTDVMTRVYNLEHGGGGSVSADAVSFDNTGTDLSSTNVEDVVKEINNKLPSGSVIDDTTTSTDSTWSSSKISTPVAGNIRYNTTSNKMEYYNGTQWVELTIGGGGMPELNFATPLQNIANGASWTATEDCYLLGNLNCQGSSDSNISIDGTLVYGIASTNNNGSIAIPPTFIKAGSVIARAGSSTEGVVKVYAIV